MDRVLAERAKNKKPTADLLDEFFDFLIEEGGSVSTVYDHHTEKDMNLAMVQPWCSIGSDGLACAIEGPLARGHPHPRSFGTFPRILGVYVRQKGLLRLEDAVRKMTSQNAAKLGIFDRGLLRPGNWRRHHAVRSGTRHRPGHLHGAVPVQRRDRIRDRERAGRCWTRQAHRSNAGQGATETMTSSASKK